MMFTIYTICWCIFCNSSCKWWISILFGLNYQYNSSVFDVNKAAIRLFCCLLFASSYLYNSSKRGLNKTAVRLQSSQLEETNSNSHFHLVCPNAVLHHEPHPFITLTMSLRSDKPLLFTLISLCIIIISSWTPAMSADRPLHLHRQAPLHWLIGPSLWPTCVEF